MQVLPTFRKLDVPDGYAWMHPAFSPDENHIAVSGLCVDKSLCPDGDNNRVYSVTNESVQIVTDGQDKLESIDQMDIHAADRLGPGRYIVAMEIIGYGYGEHDGDDGAKFYIHDNGSTRYLMDVPDGVQFTWNLEASSDASVIAYTRGVWFDFSKSFNYQPMDHQGALVIIRQGQPVQYLD